MRAKELDVQEAVADAMSAMAKAVAGLKDKGSSGEGKSLLLHHTISFKCWRYTPVKALVLASMSEASLKVAKKYCINVQHSNRVFPHL